MTASDNTKQLVFVMFMLWPWILTLLQDSVLSVQTHLLHNFWEGSDVSGRAAVFFLQSRSVVLDWGHTPGEHAQCHKTRNSHIENFIFYLG